MQIVTTFDQIGFHFPELALAGVNETSKEKTLDFAQNDDIIFSFMKEPHLLGELLLSVGCVSVHVHCNFHNNVDFLMSWTGDFVSSSFTIAFSTITKSKMTRFVLLSGWLSCLHFSRINVDDILGFYGRKRSLEHGPILFAVRELLSKAWVNESIKHLVFHVW